VALAMTLRGARVALNARETARLDIELTGGRIRLAGKARRGTEAASGSNDSIDLSGYLLLPGLINAHDHLEFALFPRLGHGPYPNASVWAADIYRPAESPIRDQLRVPKWVRLHWGGLKNLLSGVTLVAHHNPFYAPVFNNRFPVRVLRRYGWAHSLDFSPDLRDRYRETPPQWPFIVHAGEGVDERAGAEFGRLDRAGVVGARTVIVHGVALDRAELEALTRHRGSLVWCPSSNLFTLGRTLRCEALLNGFPVALATDSSLTAAGDLADEILVAHAQGIALEAIYEMVTTRAAAVLKLSSGYGAIREGGAGDLIAVPDGGQTPAESLLGLDPHLAVVAGKVRLVSEIIARRVPANGFSRMRVEGHGDYRVDADIPLLHSAASRGLGGPVLLGGKAVRA
jgi:cytosine/adenosine deaminase-related metal-dependent hydrolase